MRIFQRSRPSLSPDPLRTLHEFTRALALIVDEDELYETIAAKLREIFRLDRVAVFLRDGDGALFRIVAWRGMDAEAARTAILPAEARLVRWLRVNEAILVLSESPGVLAFLEDSEREVLEWLGVTTCVPLVATNQLTGFLALAPENGAAGRELDAADRELLDSLAGQAALAFENAALLRERKARLKRMYRAERLATAGELAAGAAHEIRNPLTGIRSAIQYLRPDYPNGSDRAVMIDDVLAEVDRIDGIVEGLLAFARPEAVRLESVELIELLRQSLGLIAVRARGQGVTVTLGAPDALHLDADPDQLKQILLNVLLNALQAMPDGGALHVAVSRRGRVVELRISDTGRGIASEHVERIFDPFFTTRKEGTGLGLSICYGIVQRHGGEMEVASEVGCGTVLTIRLPQRQGR